jgi:hypothetical protein
VINQKRADRAYRLALMRIIKAAEGCADRDAVTRAHEIRVRDIARHAPAIVARQLSRMFADAARHWERGNNSGSSEIMNREDAECDFVRFVAERVLSLWGVTCDYPGLYPCFRWQGHDYHDAQSLMIWIARGAQ